MSKRQKFDTCSNCRKMTRKAMRENSIGSTTSAKNEQQSASSSSSSSSSKLKGKVDAETLKVLEEWDAFEKQLEVKRRNQQKLKRKKKNRKKKKQAEAVTESSAPTNETTLKDADGTSKKIIEKVEEEEAAQVEEKKSEDKESVPQRTEGEVKLRSWKLRANALKSKDDVVNFYKKAAPKE